jgi:hypothetical protein
MCYSIPPLLTVFPSLVTVMTLAAVGDVIEAAELQKTERPKDRGAGVENLGYRLRICRPTRAFRQPEIAAKCMRQMNKTLEQRMIGDGLGVSIKMGRSLVTRDDPLFRLDYSAVAGAQIGGFLFSGKKWVRSLSSCENTWSRAVSHNLNL